MSCCCFVWAGGIVGGDFMGMGLLLEEEGLGGLVATFSITTRFFARAIVCVEDGWACG